MTAQSLVLAPPASIGRLRVSATDAVSGERLALATTAIAVAFLPLLAPQGPSGTAPADVFAALAIGATALWAGRSGKRLRFAYGLPMAVFIAGGALGAMAGPVPGKGIVAIVQDVMLLVWCWTFMNVASKPERLRVLVRTWAYCSIVWAVLLFVGLGAGIHFLSGQISKEGSRTALTFGDPNVSANYWMISLMLVWATGYPRRRRWRVLAYALFIAAILSTGSNSGVVSIVVATSLATVLGVRRRAGTFAAVSACGFLVVAGVLLASTVSFKSIQEKAYKSHYAFIRDGLGRGEVSVSQRGMLLHESIGLYKSGGLLGAGPVSTKTRLAAEQAPFVKEAHNDYFAALTERGAIGAFGLILLMAALVTRAAGIVNRGLKPSFAAVVVRPNAIIGALAGSMVAETVYELLHVRHLWTLFALVATLFIWGRN